ncbi:hypothetical protein JZ751_026272, partial [Albula glossodonta]
MGFSAVDLKQGQYDVSIFDLGGAQRIRDIWKHYYSESHGVIFVVDSSDTQRMQETKETLAQVLVHPRITGKPVLLLANKQDKEAALHEADIIEHLSLEELVNDNKCHCKIVPCTVVKSMGKKAIMSGLEWLLRTVASDYDNIRQRVENDTAEQREQEEKDKRERAERVRKVRQQREKREREMAVQECMTTEKEEEESTMANPFLPIQDIISKTEEKKDSVEQTGEKTDQAPAEHSPERKRKLWLWRKNKVEPLTPDSSAKTQHSMQNTLQVLRLRVLLNIFLDVPACK